MSHGKAIEIASMLNEDERKEFAKELQQALKQINISCFR